MPKHLFSFILSLVLILPLQGQQHQERFENIDVLRYRFDIDLNDSSDVIRGKADIEISFLKDVDHFKLDFANGYEDSRRMKVTKITEDDREIGFLHTEDQILLNIAPATPGTKRTYKIFYRGVPADGLIISRNKFGDRTFFGDNWPNRGHFWLPLVDHPSDKAVVEFIVSAPEHYGIVSVGENISEKRAEGRIISQWLTSVPLSTKLMVIGVSPFAIQETLSSSGIPVSTWVYPQNSKEGFQDYHFATKALNFFESYIAPYPYVKLANVQSKTVYGGMENASCIFYHERTVNGLQNHETLFAHEIAHQWFGDAVSELDWHHIWLSEGFATYLTDMYIEQTYGREAFIASMLDEKAQVLRFARRRLAPIVDTTLPVSVRLLNKNSYEKAGWVLHMLRHELGDDLFRDCIQSFYEKYKFSNALTEDFQAVVDSIGGKSYETFFSQWYYKAGHPLLSSKWEQRTDTLKLAITQHQKQHIFEFPLEVEIIGNSGESLRKTLLVNKADQVFPIEILFNIKEIQLDPDTWLFFEAY
jgi:aminopeptidase N